MNLCFPIEVKIREFIPKVFLCYHLLKKKKFHKVNIILGDKKYIGSLESLNNFLYFSKGLWGKEWNKKIKDIRKQNFIVDLDEEGPINVLRSSDSRIRLNKNEIKKFDKVFLWGQSALKIYKKKFDNNFVKKIFFVSGHPKFDLLKKPYIGIYSKEVIKIKKKFKNFVFIPSNASVDHIAGDHNFYEYTVSLLKRNYNPNLKILSDYFFEEKRNYNELVVLIKKLAEQNPNINFVFRPHPTQDINKVKLTFKNSTKNLFIIYKYTVTPWIIACNLFIHHDCMTSLEAVALKKKIVKFHLTPLNNKIKRSINVGIHFSNLEKCLFFLNRYFNNRSRIKVKFNKFSSDLVYNINKNYFIDNFLTFLKKNNFYLNEENKIFKEINYQKDSYFFLFLKKFKNIFKFIIIKLGIYTKLVKIYDYNKLLSGEYKKLKVPFIKKKEICNIINLLSKLDKIKFSFTVKKINTNVFLISN